MFNIGIIGCGAIGKDHCRRIIETVPGATVVAVSDYVAAAADETAAKYGIKSYGNDCDGMIKDPRWRPWSSPPSILPITLRHEDSGRGEVVLL